jgi:hypothetical protein
MNKLENNKAKCSGSGLQSQHLGDWGRRTAWVKQFKISLSNIARHYLKKKKAKVKEINKKWLTVVVGGRASEVDRDGYIAYLNAHFVLILNHVTTALSKKKKGMKWKKRS